MADNNGSRRVVLEIVANNISDEIHLRFNRKTFIRRVGESSQNGENLEKFWLFHRILNDLYKLMDMCER